MRFLLNITPLEADSVIPVNYQYPVSSWLYKTLNHGNPEFAAFLHKEGYKQKHKNFKLFCFSQLMMDKYQVTNDRLQILAPEIRLVVSFYPIQALEPFVRGIFTNQEFIIGDRKNKAGFRIKTIEKETEPEFTDRMKFRLLSPLHISRRDPSDPGKTTHLPPEHKDFESLFFNNLVDKYNAYMPRRNFPLNDLSFNLLSRPRSKVITIKAGTPQESRLKAWLFDFSLQAPPELIKTGYYAGFGKANSQGFGCGEIERD